MRQGRACEEILVVHFPERYDPACGLPGELHRMCSSRDRADSDLLVYSGAGGCWRCISPMPCSCLQARLLELAIMTVSLLLLYPHRSVQTIPLLHVCCAHRYSHTPMQLHQTYLSCASVSSFFFHFNTTFTPLLMVIPHHAGP